MCPPGSFRYDLDSAQQMSSGREPGNAHGHDLPRLEHPGDLPDRLGLVRDVLQHLGADHDVERMVGKRKLRDVTREDAPSRFSALALLFHQPHHVPGLGHILALHVEAHDLYARLLEGLVQMATVATPRVQDPHTRLQVNFREIDR